MPPELCQEEVAKWDRWFAGEANNVAWTLAETTGRTAQQCYEMLHAAHAAAYHWGRVGTDLHKARCEMLLAQVHALLGSGVLAMEYALRSQTFVCAHDSPDWEVALMHAVLANAAFAAGNMSLYDEHYALARRLGEAIADAEDRAIFNSTFSQVPVPSPEVA